VRLTAALPEELRFVAADAGGLNDAAARRVVWQLDSLAPGEVAVCSFTALAELPGDVHCRAEAEAEDGLLVEAKATVRVRFGERGDRALLDELLAGLDGAALGEAPAAPQDTPLPATNLGERQVVFSLAGTDYAVPLANVLEMGRPLAVTPTPNVPEWVLGVANLRGDIISVVDLRAFFGLDRSPPDQSQRVLVVRAGTEDLTTGLVVDRVKGMRYILPERVASAAGLSEDRTTAYTRGVTEHEGRLLVLLELDRLLLSEEMRQFEFV
jgi:purine-binding chemotaxis protein CheW